MASSLLLSSLAMTRTQRVSPTILLIAASLVGCTIGDESEQDVPGLDDNFERAAAAHGVPADLLKAVSYVETRWDMVEGDDEHERGHAGAGVFGLWGDNLARGAAAAGLGEDKARHDLDANIAAGAARLAELGRAHGVAGDDLVAWAPALADFSQLDEQDGRVDYVDDVLRVLATGATLIAEDGTPIATLDARADVPMPSTPRPRAANTDYAGAIWRQSPNQAGRGSHGVSIVVIHTCEGAYTGCWSWLRNSSSGVSAHYVVNETGSEVTQLVRASQRAYHISAAYDSSRNNGKLSNKNGVGTNYFSVGIEHGGYGSQASWNAGLIATSAKLTCSITKRHNIIRDRNHIVGHGQLQPWNRSDPGKNWPWSDYIDRVRAECGDGNGTTPPPPPPPGGSTPPPATPALIIDSNDANNNPAVAKMELTGTWTSSSATPGYYGTGYWAAQTAAVSQPATFKFYLAAPATKTIDAWWTSGSNRASNAPFIAFGSNGKELGRKVVDQRANGSQWVTLGTWTFPAGWNSIVLSRWAESGKQVIADAVRVR